MAVSEVRWHDCPLAVTPLAIAPLRHAPQLTPVPGCLLSWNDAQCREEAGGEDGEKGGVPAHPRPETHRGTDADDSGRWRQEKVVSMKSISLHFRNNSDQDLTSLSSPWRKRPVKAPTSLSETPPLQLHVSKVTGSRGYWADFPWGETCIFLAQEQWRGHPFLGA